MKKFNVLFVVWIIILLVIFSLLSYIGFMYKEKVSHYKKFEALMLDAAKVYAYNNSYLPVSNSTIKITLDELIESGSIKKNKNNKECTGYVEVSNYGEYSFDAFVKCGYYKTKN